MCSLVPSVTIYGTTQIPVATVVLQTSLSVVTPDPVVSTSYTTISSDCIGDTCLDTKTKPIVVTVTPDPVTQTVSAYVTTTALVTSVVPDQTLYYPCSSTKGAVTASTTTTATNVDIKGGLSSLSSTDEGSSSVSLSAAVFSQTSATGGKASNLLPVSVSSPSTVIGTSPSGTPVSIPGQASSEALVIPTGSSDPASSQLPHSTSSSSSDRSSSTSAADTSSKSSKSHATSIAGGIIGGLIALAILFFLGIWLQKRRYRNREDREDEVVREGGEGGDQEYWERRFRQLENDADTPSGGEREEMVGEGDEKDFVLDGNRKLHLTLDLQSKEISSRPPSRLSTISSFFNNRSSPQKVRIPNPSQSGKFNFSRPLRNIFPSSDSDSISKRSKRMSQASSGSRGLRKLDIGALSLQRLSKNWLPKVSVAGSPPTPNWVTDAAGEERRAMEWVRPMIVDAETETETVSVGESSGKRSSMRYTTSSFGSAKDFSTSSRVSDGTWDPWPGISTLGNGGQISPSKTVTASTSSPPRIPAAVYMPQQLESSRRPSGSTSSGNAKQSIPRNTNVNNTTQSPSGSVRKSKRPPELKLGREAVTPSLWIDDQTLADLGYPGQSRKASVETQEGSGEAVYGGITSVSSVDSHSTSTKSTSTTRRNSRSRDSTSPKAENDGGRTPTLSKVDLSERSAVTPQLPVVIPGFSPRFDMNMWSASTVASASYEGESIGPLDGRFKDKGKGKERQHSDAWGEPVDHWGDEERMVSVYQTD